MAKNWPSELGWLTPPVAGAHRTRYGEIEGTGFVDANGRRYRKQRIPLTGARKFHAPAEEAWSGGVEPEVRAKGFCGLIDQPANSDAKSESPKEPIETNETIRNY